jgi:predicted nuclease of predicted toxin-antitoxin system
MQFLIDEDLPRSEGDLFRRYGHEVSDVRDIGLRGAKDSEIASYVQNKGLCLVTGDFDFSGIRNYPPSKYAGLVVVSVPMGATAVSILNMIEGFLEQIKLVSQLAGKLAVVETGRIRIRGG